jgi:uncharacterized membrane protein/RNA polymerase subunit RPABC4/transcription elongation factor Spt4
MYCRHCGKDINDQAVVCVGCGAPPLTGKKFCQSCGKDTAENAEVCTNCGVRLATGTLSTGMTGADEGKVFAFLAYLLGLIGVLVVYLAKKDNPFALYHAKQSLVLSIAAIILSVGAAILAAVPFVGWILALVIWIVDIGVLVLWIIGMVNALGGQQKPLPIIGEYAEKINL